MLTVMMGCLCLPFRDRPSTRFTADEMSSDGIPTLLEERWGLWREQ